MILDSGVVIAGAQGRIELTALTDTDDVALPAIAVAEYRTGILLDNDPGRVAAQHAFLEDMLAVLPICNYDRTVAEHHASLLSHVRRSGTRRGAHDLIIAATARATARVVITTDKRARFGELPEVSARLITD